VEEFEHPARRHLGDDGVGDRGGGVVGGAQEHAAQADEVAREPDVDHLPAAVGQQLVAAGPAVPQDERPLARLALADELGAGGDRAALRLERGQRGQLLAAGAAVAVGGRPCTLRPRAPGR
jgi:hypothetical protein